MANTTSLMIGAAHMTTSNTLRFFFLSAFVTFECIGGFFAFKTIRKKTRNDSCSGIRKFLSLPAQWILPGVPFLWLIYQQIIGTWEECAYGVPFEFHCAALFLGILATPEVGNASDRDDEECPGWDWLWYYFDKNSSLDYVRYLDAMYWALVRYVDAVWVVISIESSAPLHWQMLFALLFVFSLLMYLLICGRVSCYQCDQGEPFCTRQVGKQALFGRSPIAMWNRAHSRKYSGRDLTSIRGVLYARLAMDLLQICPRLGLAAWTPSLKHQVALYLHVVLSSIANVTVFITMSVPMEHEFSDAHVTDELESLVTLSDTSSTSWACIGRPNCFVEPTYFKTPDRTYVSVNEVEVGEVLLSINGTQIEVERAEKLPAKEREFVRFSCNNTEITVTHDHRMVVLRGGEREPFPAGNVKEGDQLLGGDGEQRVQKIHRFKATYRVYRLSFKPDIPIELFVEPPINLAAYGDKKGTARRGGRKPAECFHFDETKTADSFD